MEIPEAGRYHLWVRAVGGTGLAYRLDGAKDAVEVAIDKGQDPIPVAADGNPFYPPTAAWYDLGLLDLTQGKHTITWYLGGLKEKVRWGGMDCFVLTTGAFTPNGKYKPGEKSPEPIPAFQPGQAWDFVPGGGQARPGRRAGPSLPQREGRRRARFHPSEPRRQQLRARRRRSRSASGRPRRVSAPEVDLAARKHDAQFLAKRGVNFARVWCNLYPDGRGLENHRRG